MKFVAVLSSVDCFSAGNWLDVKFFFIKKKKSKLYIEANYPETICDCALYNSYVEIESCSAPFIPRSSGVIPPTTSR